MSKRSGVTLVEVLIAIFVTAIGLLALLVLFPVGALNMAQAIKDDRTAHCAANAKRLANFWDLRHDSSTGVFATTAVPPVPADPTPWTLGATPANSAFETPSMWGCNAQFITVAAGPSYPVFIDPAGYATFSTAPLGGSNSPIPRVMPRFL
ncbi:MAG TPA: prepilin-type N-terminal cleavage/methylation domain-containing protein, partial [Gemmataceae bacterium]|nr:prepilin-type N-terminal cleavage/methylation domain-containing protein [Gemmataceae bacterium]